MGGGSGGSSPKMWHACPNKFSTASWNVPYIYGLNGVYIRKRKSHLWFGPTLYTLYNSSQAGRLHVIFDGLRF